MSAGGREGWVSGGVTKRIIGTDPSQNHVNRRIETMKIHEVKGIGALYVANLATTLQEAVAARPGGVWCIPTEIEVTGSIASAKELSKLVKH